MTITTGVCIYLIGCILGWILMYTDCKYLWVNGTKDDTTIIQSVFLSIFSWMMVLCIIVIAITHRIDNHEFTILTSIMKRLNQPLAKSKEK